MFVCQTENSDRYGGAGGIGAGVVRAFLREGYNVVATARNISSVGRRSSRSDKLALVDGDIAEAARGGQNCEAPIEQIRIDRRACE